MFGRVLGVASVATGVAVAIVAWLWVMTPLPIYTLGSAYRARYDLANDLYAWGPGRRLIEQAVDEARLDAQKLPVVVGPHYIVCAQAHAVLGGSVPVGCNSPIRDDFDAWYPRQRWLDAPVVLYVQDSRFEVDPRPSFRAASCAAWPRPTCGAAESSCARSAITRLDKMSGTARE